MALKKPYLILFSLLISGCFWNKKEEHVVRLGDLIPLQVSSNQTLVRVSTDEQIKLYKDLLNYVNRAELRAQILSRIADLELMYQDQLSEREEESDAPVYIPDYQLSIEQYHQLLDTFPQRKNNDDIYYQLAKSYDLSGDSRNALLTLTKLIQKYPNSQYKNEANFRRGNYLFSLGQFDQAESAFSQVVKAGKKTNYYVNANYMFAWSLFKQNKYESSLEVFTQILDENMSYDGRLASISPSKLPLVEDSIRVQAIIFSYLGGVDDLVKFYAKHEEKSYSLLIYKALGELFDSQGRYSDAVNTYRAYIKAYPLSPQSPVFSNQIMTTMRKAGFKQRIFYEKENFINSYNVQSDYYKVALPESQDYIDDYLYAYIDEMGRAYHAKAQYKSDQLRRYKIPPPEKLKAMKNSYDQAIDYHRLFITTFPDDFHTSEKSYLIAEAYAKKGEWLNAVRAYEMTAYDFPIHNFSEMAAYSVILGYKKIISKSTKSDSRPMLEKSKLLAELAFVDHFSSSQYVRPIMLATIDTFYKQKQYKKAVQQAQGFLVKTPDAKPDEKLLINLVVGHSSFELQNFKEAEKYYLQSLKTLDKKDKRYKKVFNRIAASIYKQGELLASKGKKIEAVDQFLRVGKFAPKSNYRKTAEYDAATYLIQEKEWERAILLLNSYRNRYDRKKTNLDITGKLVASYEGLKQFDLAAKELKRVHRDEKDPEKRRQALFLSAEYYERSGQDEAALSAFRDYTHRYPEPFDLAMETRYKLSEMYRKKGDDNRRKYWLDAIIVKDMRAGDRRTARSKYLAARSRNVFAEEYLKQYESIKLSMPLSRSLPNKKAALEAVLKRYQKILEYEIQEFSTLATYNVANIYATLSNDMMESERPSGLSDLELEQYELLLEEQAYPFEEKATEIHESNLENSWHGNFDKWVGKSIQALSELYPAKYKKQEIEGGFSDNIF